MTQDSQEIFDYIFGLTVPGVKLELSRVEAFVRRIGNPHKDYPIVHIAGTNGKGSTAAMLAAITNAYGMRTGLFTSPHLIKPNERIRVGETLVPDDFIIDTVETWRKDIDELGITFFEVLAALGMAYFKEQGVDLAVFETGLGGRLDATNIVLPEVSVITAISKDHENILGDTLEKIAAEKAGIIKKEVPLVLGKNVDSVIQLMDNRCKELKSEFHYVPQLCSFQKGAQSGLHREAQFSCGSTEINVGLPLPGDHQLDNFANVLVTLQQLGLKLEQDLIQDGLNQMKWLGRMQTLNKEPLVIYDVAHNPEGLSALLKSFGTAGMEDTILIAAFNARKDVSSMLDILNDWKGSVLYTDFEGYSALGREAMIKQGIDPKLILADPISAFMHAKDLLQSSDQAICFLGSHYLAESLFEHFHITI